MADLVIKISGKSDAFQKELDKVGKQTANLEKQLASVAKVSAVAFAGFTAAIVGAASEAAKFETIQTSFEVLTGGADTAAKSIKQLQEFSAKTPFQFEEIAKSGQKLLGFGFKAEQLPKVLGQIGDVAAAVNAPMGDLSLIFGQVSAAGKLTGERLDQLQQRAIPIGPALAKTLGVAETSIKDLVSQGKVTDEVFKKAFATLVEEGGPAFGGMEKQSRTLAGKISTLKDNFSLVVAEVGKQFVPALKFATDLITKMFQFIRENPEITKLAAGFLAAGAAISLLVGGLTTVALVFLKAKTAITAAGGALRLFSLGVRGLLGATGIGLLIILIADLALNFETRLNQITFFFSDFAKNISKIIEGLGTSFKGLFDLDLGKISEGFDQIKSAFGQVDDERKKDEERAIASQDRKTEASLSKSQERNALEKEQREQFLQEFLEEQELTNQLENEQKEAFRQENQKMLEKSLLNERKARTKVLQDRLKARIDSNNRFLQEQVKFGTAFATVNKTIRSDEVQGFSKGTSELTQLTQSRNSTLKGIGKAAAVSQILIKTAQSAMNIYAGFSAIPFVGPALGIAGAAAAIAFGAEQVGKVTAAQQGGLITGGISGVDSVPALLTPGELVVPQSNFEEVIGAVSQARGNTTDVEDTDTGGGGGGAQTVMIGFDGPEASQVLTARQNEDKALGLSREA